MFFYNVEKNLKTKIEKKAKWFLSNKDIDKIKLQENEKYYYPIDTNNSQRVNSVLT